MRHDTNFTVTDGKKIFGSAANRSHTTTYKISADHSDMCIIVPVFERPELEDCLNYCRQSLERAGKKASIIIVDQTLTKATLRKTQASLAALATSPSVTNIIYHH